MRKNWLLPAAAAVAALITAPAALAASAGTGTSTSSSPGVSQNNDSTTGVGIPSVAPVDSQTLQPVQIGTGARVTSSTAKAARQWRMGTGAPAYTDLSQGGTGSSSSAPSNGDTGK
jgi:hypothetical protein